MNTETLFGNVNTWFKKTASLFKQRKNSLHTL